MDHQFDESYPFVYFGHVWSYSFLNVHLTQGFGLQARYSTDLVEFISDLNFSDTSVLPKPSANLNLLLFLFFIISINIIIIIIIIIIIFIIIIFIVHISHH